MVQLFHLAVMAWLPWCDHGVTMVTTETILKEMIKDDLGAISASKFDYPVRANKCL